MSIPTRPLGKTGVNLSILCLGGWHIGQPAIDADAERIMHAAIDHGVTFFDNAWDYHDGRSEEVMGKALATGGRRQKVFLMTKNCGRDAATSRQHLEDSLRRLQTDVIDLWQFHEINYDNDPEWIVERGALAVALEAQKAGKVRFIGFTGHKHPDIFLKMLGVYDNWSTCQLPVNVCDYFYRSSIHEVLPELRKKNVAAIGMKSLGGGNMETGGRIVAGGVASAEECIRFALSQDVATLVTGVDSMKVLMQNVGIARDFKPMPKAEADALLARVKPVATDGRFEWSKSTQNFDGPYHRRQHGFDV